MKQQHLHITPARIAACPVPTKHQRKYSGCTQTAGSMHFVLFHTNTHSTQCCTKIAAEDKLAIVM